MNLRVLLIATMLAAGCSSVPSTYDVPEAPQIDAVPASTGSTRSYYVDPLLQVNPCTRYDPATRACGRGTELAFNNLSDVNGLAQAGDTILLRTGTYSEQIAPLRSGTEDAPIRYMPYNSEHAELAYIEEPALWLIDVQHIHIEGLSIHDVVGWGRLQNAHHNHISENDFVEAQARGTTGGLKLVDSHYNRIHANTFYRGNDSIVVQSSDRNLITDNHLQFARHALFSVRCGNFNVLRNNFLHNQRQKIGEIYDCEAVSDAPFRLNATRRNLVEGNHFAFARGSDQPTRYAGIQFAGQLGLVRHNLFKENEGGAIHFAVYEHEALNNFGNRVFANWFFDNRCYAVSGSSLGGVRVGDNQVAGNTFSGNVDCLGYRHTTRNAPGMILRDNAEQPTPTQELPEAWWAFTTAAGAGTTIPLGDVIPFYDGFGINGERGDLIEVRSTQAKARILRIDYDSRTVTVDRDMTWAAADGIRVVQTAARTPFTVVPSPRLRVTE